MSRLRLAAPIIVLMLTVAGCGGSTVTVEEVPGGAVPLTVPGTGEAFKPAATPTASPSASVTPTPTTGASAGTTGQAPSSDGTASTGTGTTGGGTQAPSGNDSATNDQPPPAGSDAQQFEDFCAQNPGAC